MDVRLSRAAIPERADPHNWHSWDNYRSVHEKRLAAHGFVDHSKPDTLRFVHVSPESIRLEGRVFCQRGVMLDVEKVLQSSVVGGVVKVRGVKYRYVAWVAGRHNVLRYHNFHRRDSDYHHRVFNPLTGEEVFYEKLERSQFPTFTEVLDEIEYVTRVLEE